MTNQAPQNNSKQNPIVVLTIIWGALLMSHFMYGFVLTMMLKQKSDSGSQDLSLVQTIQIPLLVVALGLLVMTFLIPDKIFKTNLAKINREDKKQMIVAYTVPFVLILAFSEAISMLGFIQGIFFLSMKPFYLFAAVGALNMILNFPSEQKILEKAKNI